MCFDLDSRPPIRPIAGGSIESGSLVLRATDGNELRAFRARAAEPTGAGMLVLPDVRGLHPYYEELALRFAENGIDALAIDYFGRTAGTDERGDEFDHQPHVAELTWAGLAADVRAGGDFLRSHDGGAVRAVFTMGFCMGGRLAFNASTLGLGLAGAIGFYGWPVGERRDGSPAPATVVSEFGNPVLGIFGGADQGIPSDAVSAFEQALASAGIEHRIVTYDRAPHSFFDRKQADFADASAAAWGEVLDFVGSHT